ncbi:pimeloyl-ACP methyl ester carboxylesterase [Actinoplanes tereljensis]|uniref:Peptidase n=1 Tax=Paractinoplanes tereljensis TaxID=571912 RepID=A0A919NK41_9ACTN|nr:alpha/beta fold hydrolase [Actinoplanes tereljensis]GIF19943.1 peptidase [Actinoplanes tereljensis]
MKILGAVAALLMLSAGPVVAGPVAPPALDWQDCGDGVYQCSPFQVPLDYRHPGGTRVTLQLRRWPAAKPADRIGTLFIYAGGPGSSGWEWVQGFATSAVQEIRDRFDIVGFDPRGVHRSQPVSCLDQPDYAALWQKPATLANAVRSAQQWNAACLAHSGGLLPFIGTEYQARDLDRLRAAVGDAKLTYFGGSYATYVGTVYASMFPGRTRALVLDSAYDPVKYAQDPYSYDYGQYQATEAALQRFLRWCAATPASCAFAAGGPDLAGRVRAILDSLSGSVNGATVLSELTSRLNSGTRRWTALGTDLHLLENHTGPLMYAISQSDTAFNAVNVAVECADRVFPPGMRQLDSRLSEVAADFPLTAPRMAYGPPAYDQTHAPACLQWPAERLSRYTGSYRAVGSAPILVSGNTGDPDTPYADAVALSRILANGHLLTWQGEGHTARRKSACMEAYMYEYLLRLTVPPAGTVCRDAPIPG